MTEIFVAQITIEIYNSLSALLTIVTSIQFFMCAA